MSTSYDDAVSTLYRACVDVFVAERKRLAAELKAAGDKAGAARLAKLPRPTVAAWTVNQLFWQASDVFDELLAAGQRLRGGDLAATGAHREATAKLRARAVTLLGASDHAATESTLRRVMNSLAALAASGGFDPDPPGALAEDRQPPGFDLLGLELPETGAPEENRGPSRAERPPPPKEGASSGRTPAAHGMSSGREARERERKELEEQRRQREAERRELEEQRRRAEEERARKEAERRQLDGALHRAKRELEMYKRQVDRLKSDLAEAEKMLAQAESAVADIAARLGAL
jgi:hypothetical protein